MIRHLGDDPLEEESDELLALGGICLAGPELAEACEELDAALPVEVLDRPALGELAGELSVPRA